MDRNDQEFRSALYEDLRTTYMGGFERTVDPMTIPALAELAKALNPNPKSHGATVGAALKWTIGQVANRLGSVFTRSNHRNIIEGLEILFGLHSDSPKALTNRRDLAGPLLGYPTGSEGLRHGEHRKASVEQIILTEMVAQLTAMGQAVNFSYSARFATGNQPLITSRDSPNPDDRGAKLEVLGHTLLAELDRLMTGGINDGAALSYLSTLRTIAYACYASDVERDTKRYSYKDRFSFKRPESRCPNELADLILWGLYQLDYDADIQGMATQFGFGEGYGLNYMQRRGRAAIYFGCKVPIKNRYKRSPKESEIITALMVVIGRVAVQLGVWPVTANDQPPWE